MTPHDPACTAGTTQALVLGGGGLTGMAWMLGWLHGAEAAGLRVADFGHIVGTSAGATVGAQITAGLPLAELYRRQVEGVARLAELAPTAPTPRQLLGLLATLRHWRRPLRWRKAIGQWGRRVAPRDDGRRRAAVAARLAGPEADWPAGVRLDLTAVDATSGELGCFARGGPAALAEAVAASCAVPGLWPPVRIAGRDWFDGGICSCDNAHLAHGAAAVLVLSPLGASRLHMPGPDSRAQVAALRAAGSRAALVHPDAAARAAMGRNPFDAARLPATARAAREQALGEAAAVLAMLRG